MHLRISIAAATLAAATLALTALAAPAQADGFEPEHRAGPREGRIAATAPGYAYRRHPAPRRWHRPSRLAGHEAAGFEGGGGGPMLVELREPYLPRGVIYNVPPEPRSPAWAGWGGFRGGPGAYGPVIRARY